MASMFMLSHNDSICKKTLVYTNTAIPSQLPHTSIFSINGVKLIKCFHTLKTNKIKHTQIKLYLQSIKQQGIVEC